MYKLCKTEQSAQRQRQLEEGLLDAMLIQRFEDISVSDLCDQLEIPRKSFYRYFASKDGALHALVDHRLMEFELKKDISGKDKGTEPLPLTWFFEYWKSQKKLLDALSKSGLSSILAERAMILSEETSVFAFQSRRVPKNYQQIANTFVVCGLMTLVIQWYQNGFRESLNEMAEITRILLTRPLVPDLN